MKLLEPSVTRNECAVGFDNPLPPPTGVIIPVNSNFSAPPAAEGVMVPPMEFAVLVTKFNVVCTVLFTLFVCIVTPLPLRQTLSPPRKFVELHPAERMPKFPAISGRNRLRLAVSTPALIFAERPLVGSTSET